MLLAERIPYRAEMSEVYRYLRVQLQEMGVPVFTGCELTEEKIDELNPDIVIAATGSKPVMPEIESGEVILLNPREAMEHVEKIGEKVVLIDDIGYWQAMGVADYVGSVGADVTVVTKEYYPGKDIEETCQEILYKRLLKNGGKAIVKSRLQSVSGKTVVLDHVVTHEESRIEGVDTLIVAGASRSENELYKRIKSKGDREVYAVGDAAAPGTVLRIIFEAEELARRL